AGSERSERISSRGRIRWGDMTSSPNPADGMPAQAKRGSISRARPRRTTMADPTHRRFPHDDLEQLAANLWTVRGSLPFPLKRQMIIYRLADGTLLLHSVIAMNDEGMAKLDALGRPSVMIVPHIGHRMDAPFYKARYPQVRVL